MVRGDNLKEYRKKYGNWNKGKSFFQSILAEKYDYQYNSDKEIIFNLDYNSQSKINYMGG